MNIADVKRNNRHKRGAINGTVRLVIEKNFLSPIEYLHEGKSHGSWKVPFKLDMQMAEAKEPTVRSAMV